MLPFAIASFLGAFLLFAVQPLLGRYLVPWFGGSAAVWSGCLVFFQTALLAGYTYAHCGRVTQTGPPKQLVWMG